MRSAVAVVALLVMSVLIPQRTANGNASVDSLLRQRIESVVGRDEEKFMATVDAEAALEFRESERKRFQGLMSIPVVNYQLEISETDSGDLATGLDLRRKYGVDRAYLPETRERFRLGDYDSKPMRNTFWYTYVQRDGDWFVASGGDAADVGLDNTPNVWDHGPLRVEKTKHFLVLSHGDNEERLRQVAGIAERAHGQFSNKWSRPWWGKVPIIVPSSNDEAKRLLRTRKDVNNFVAFTMYVPERSNNWEPTPPRLFVNESNLVDASEESQTGTLVHELVHAALAEISGPNVPLWLHEGLAQWIRLGKPNSVALKANVPRELPSEGEFSSSSGSVVSDAYERSASAVAYLAKTKGSEAPVQLFAEVGSRRSVIGSPSFNVDESWRKLFGESQSTFIERWQSD